jgi:capsular polysaccharide biosynthesis protein
MTLPYPPEVESGALPTRAPIVREPFDVERHLHEAIRASGADLQLFGVSCEALEPEKAAALINRFRDTLSTHFQERFPNADATTWSLFESQARSQVERSPHIDDSTLRALLMTIDGL